MAVAPEAALAFAAAPPDVRRLIRDRRYCKLLAVDSDLPFEESSKAFAWQAVEQEMALVPAGEVRLATSLAATAGWVLEANANAFCSDRVETLYLDRYPVTNADFARFVAAGAYEEADYWPEEVLPNVLQFVDITGHPGPRYWSQGRPDANKLNHPVVGVCWYEANAYAVWAGKRLPTSAEWQRAGTWSRSSSSAQLRYPWGNAFDPRKANLRAAGILDTVAVDAFPEGRSLNGVQQLIGNVWEWVRDLFHLEVSDEIAVVFDQPMAEVRGGAFDTFFQSQATCQFRTGQPYLHRSSNVGFRCCISDGRLAPLPDSMDSSEGIANA
ncbi:formylglycine-generating enzyme family protein [Candidatus Laterigemmans baculatus]|uniref:formylglycine-generating enzyme family protein n=1 Tax=Candidatus Laterigemmans baculatus TaxID=2770505 RepID=UPI0013D998CA|nr:SUMF1/EgtB/PvdO family nonheme iron enzyme [Candidatus Laterigemmans baculatus]